MKTNDQLRAENKAISDMLAAGPEQQLLAIPGVIHVSVGLKEKNGRVTDQLCVRVYVKDKKSKEAVPLAELIPADVNGVPTDVNTVGKFKFSTAFGPPTDNTKYRPIKGGIAITNRIWGRILDIDRVPGGPDARMEYGTLGFIAIDNTDNAPVLVSCRHVLYANTDRPGDKVFQPVLTDLPPIISIEELPYRPNDSDDKIGVLRRDAISDKVDGAIAAIDVSSCCHCCGVYYSNEINGLSVSARPPLNTITGDERAFGGMAVFKVGAKTERCEGTVVDADYPHFAIREEGITYEFSRQIAILNISPAGLFSGVGDSGSAIINDQNRIVGMLIGACPDAPFYTIANHISDVLTQLNIRIPYSPNIIVTAGETLTDFPPAVLEAPIPAPYRALRERLQNHEVTAKLLAIGQRHSDEVTYLINHCRPVTVAWHRCRGPALLATVMSAVRDGHYRLPATVKGVTPYEVLKRMRVVLSQHGSKALKETMEAAQIDVEELFKDCDNLSVLIDRIARDEGLLSLFEGISL